jgi:hypothetical protein
VQLFSRSSVCSIVRISGINFAEKGHMHRFSFMFVKYDYPDIPTSSAVSLYVNRLSVRHKVLNAFIFSLTTWIYDRK